VKKALVVLLAVAMIFCFAASAMATTYTDMADQTATGQDAVAFMSALNVIGGYPDGTYGPAKNITRAEFAKIAVNAAGLADSAAYMADTASKFSDVKVGAWYTGFVNLAAAQGYVTGYPDGTFRPNATITNQEVVTVLMRMLGYDDNLTGPWPVDYINKAVKLDILDDVNFVGAVPANRVDVAIMAKATLDAYTVDWNNDTEAFDFVMDGANKVSLLEDSFGAGTVVTDKAVAGMAAGAATVDLGEAFTYNADDEELILNAGGKEYTMTADTVISDGMTFDQLAGQQVDLVLKNAGEKDETVAYIDVKSYTKTFDDVTTAATATKVGLDDKNYDVDADAVLANFAAKGAASNTNLVAYFNNDDEVYAVISDKGYTGADKMGIVEEVSSNGKFTCHSGSLDTVSDEADVLIIKNGAAAKLADIKEFDAVKEFATTGGDKVYLVSALATAKLDKVYTAATTLGGVKYVNAFAAADVFDVDGDAVTLNDYLGDNVSYLLNANNEIEAIFCGQAVESNTVKGIITDYETADGAYAAAGELKTITVFQEDGKTATYNVDDNEYVYTPAATAIHAIVRDKGQAITIGNYVEFTVDADNNIKTAKTIAADTVTDDETSYTTDDENYRITVDGVKYNVTKDTLIYNLTKTTDTPAKLDTEILTRDDLCADTSISADPTFIINTFNAFDPNLSIAIMHTDNDADVIVLMDADATTGTKYGFVEDSGYTNADGDEVLKLYGDATEYIVNGGVAPADDTFHSYTVSGDEITLGASIPFTYAGTVKSISAVSSGLVTFIKTPAVPGVDANSDGDYLDAGDTAPVAAVYEQGEITEDTVIFHVTYTPAGGVAIDEIETWTEADLDEAQHVYYQITDGDLDYIVVVE